MSTNPLNDISKVYLEQVASQEVEEGYQPIGREKESAMYRRAGNLARTSLASKGKEKLAAAKKSATIVGAITRQKEKERFDSIGQSPSHNEEAKPDYLDFDKDGNKKESMKKALRDKKKVEERFIPPSGEEHKIDPNRIHLKSPKKNMDDKVKQLVSRGDDRSHERARNIMKARLQTVAKAKGIELAKKVEEAAKPNDGNLANNYPPYDKVTRGDVIAGRLGKDQMGGKKKAVKEGFSNWREDLREVMSSVEKKDNDTKITEKKVENKIKTSAIGGGITLPEAIENLGGTLLEMEEIDEKITANTEMGTAIKDFYASKSPQLAGRTKEERRKAAIAAVLTARRGGRKRVEEQAMEMQPKTQSQKPQNTSAINQVLFAKQQADTAQKNLAMKQRMAAQKGVNLTSLTAGYEPEGEVIDGKRIKEESTAKKALAMVKASMGSGLMTGKEKPAELTPAQKEAKQKASDAYIKRTFLMFLNN